MKYLVNRETKEHRIFRPDDEYVFMRSTGWEVIEADSEGWIKHDGGECPLPDDAMCDIRFNNGKELPNKPAYYWLWTSAGKDYEIAYYRPILNDKVEAVGDTPYPVGDPRGWEQVSPTTILDRLRASHKAASELPDIIEELRDTLGPELMEMLWQEEDRARYREEGEANV